MQSFTSAIWSSVGRKILNGLTGLMLSAFMLIHLVENLLLFKGPEKFNKWVYFLTSFDELLWVIEFLLVLVFVVHIISAVNVWLSKLKARPESYKKLTTAGGPSRQTVFSKSMIYTGGLLLIFLVGHIITLKYGPHYSVEYNGIVMRDMYRLVMEVFRQPGYVIWYEVIMILLGFHLRHGFWSAFQSLGVSHPKYSPLIYTAGILFAVIIAVGFLSIPVWIYLGGGAA